MPTIVNLTPHPLRLYHPRCPDRIDSLDAEPVTAIYPAADKPVRLATIDLGRQTSFPPINLVEYSYVHDLPAQDDGVWLVVPLVVALGARHREDLLAPYLEVRNAEGTVIGCRAFQRAV